MNLCKYKIVILSLMMCLSPALRAQTSIQTQAEEIAEGDVFGDAVVGICARYAAGRTIIDVNAEDMLLPASNMKLISTGAALHSLGGEYRYKTQIGHSGEIADGVLKGDLYIIGGGDPTIGSKDSIATPLELTFSQWEKIIRSAGIRKIEGRIFGSSGDFFSGMQEEPTWLWNDIGTYYGAGVTGLMFYENVQSFNVTAGDAPGKPLRISPSYPHAPWMEFRYDCTTGKPGTGDQLYMYTSDLAPIAEIRGTFAVDRAPKRVDCSNKFPEYTCASLFCEWLEKRGLECSEGVTDSRLNDEEEAGSITVLGFTESPSLRRIAFETNHISNNLFAETLFRTLGKESLGNGGYDSTYVAIRNILREIGVDTSRGARIQDGSGLSRQNYVSPDFLCRYLQAMMDSPAFDDFLYSLPSPGGNGTLSYNMRNYPAEMKTRIKVKSGSMNGVRCYSGYILPSGNQTSAEDTIIFSIMVNNCTAQTWQVRPLLDKIMVALAAAN